MQILREKFCLLSFIFCDGFSLLGSVNQLLCHERESLVQYSLRPVEDHNENRERYVPSHVLGVEYVPSIQPHNQQKYDHSCDEELQNAEHQCWHEFYILAIVAEKYVDDQPKHKAKNTERKTSRANLTLACMPL